METTEDSCHYYLHSFYKCTSHIVSLYSTDLAEGNHEPKLNLREDFNVLVSEGFAEEDLEVGAMTRTGTTSSSNTLGAISRHSSLISLQNEHRGDSASPSSFGDEEDEDMLDDSDVDIS